MKRPLFFGIFFAIIAMFSACTSVPDREVIKVDTAEIEGDTAHLVSIVPGSYAIVMKKSEGKHLQSKESYTSYHFTINIKIKLIKQTSLPTGSIWKVDYPSMNIKLSLLDKDGVELSNFSIKDNQSLDQDLQGLFKSTEGTEKELTFESSTETKDDAIKIMTEAAGIKITGFNTEIYVDPEVQAAKEAAKTTTSDSPDSGNVSDWLNEYDNYVTKYISLMKRAKNGDTSVISEYTELLQSAQDLGEKISNSQGNLSPSDLARFQQIQQKFLNAAQDY